MSHAGSFQTQIQAKQSFLGHIEHVLTTIKYPSQSSQGPISQTIPTPAPILDPATLSALSTVVAQILAEKKMHTDELRTIIALYLFEVAKTHLPPEDRATANVLDRERDIIAASQNALVVKTLESLSKNEPLKKNEEVNNKVVAERMQLAKALAEKVEEIKISLAMKPQPIIAGGESATLALRDDNVLSNNAGVLSNNGPLPPVTHR